MVTAENILEIEFDGPQNENPVFRPLQRKLRGRFDLNRIKEPQARLKANLFPDPIPGQRIRVNLDNGEAAVVEPLSMPEFEPIRSRYEFDDNGRKRFRFAPEVEPINVELPTLLYWMRADVNAGTAKVVRGSFPEKIEGKPQRNFYTPRTAPEATTAANAMAAMAAALAANTEVMGKLLAKLGK